MPGRTGYLRFYFHLFVGVLVSALKKVTGRDISAIITLTERSSRFVMLGAL